MFMSRILVYQIEAIIAPFRRALAQLLNWKGDIDIESLHGRRPPEPTYLKDSVLSSYPK